MASANPVVVAVAVIDTREIRYREPAQIPDALGHLHPIVGQVLASRGARDAADLQLSLSDLLPVSSLGQVSEAAQLIWSHRNGHVVVVGDFDADGATSSALVLRCLNGFGFAKVSYLVPNRFEFGYGLTPELVAVAAEMQPTLIITVDNGISSERGVQAARDLEVDVLITDHHLPPENLPVANVIVNPNCHGDAFESGSLAGVGVAFYVMVTVGRIAAEKGVVDAAKLPSKYLDLVALGTVADVVPLDRNNRILVKAGLQRIRAGRCVPAITALLVAGRRDPSRATAEDLAFAVGPRLNAAGRLEDMSVGIEALITDDASRAQQAAAQLDRINLERREIEAKMQQDALSAVEEVVETVGGSRAICLFQPDWHQGVVGLVASRVKERLHRPVFAFAAEGEGQLKGSGRSIPGVHLRDVLAFVDSRSPRLMKRFGGHAMAAGLSLERHDLSRFRDALDNALQALYPQAEFRGEWLVEALAPTDEFGLALAELLNDAGPYGQNFEPPLFAGDFIVDSARAVGGDHLKLRVRPAAGQTALDAIAFGQAEHLPLAKGQVVTLVCHLEVNQFRGIRAPQLRIQQLTCKSV